MFVAALQGNRGNASSNGACGSCMALLQYADLHANLQGYAVIKCSTYFVDEEESGTKCAHPNMLNAELLSAVLSGSFFCEGF